MRNAIDIVQNGELFTPDHCSPLKICSISALSIRGGFRQRVVGDCGAPSIMDIRGLGRGLPSVKSFHCPCSNAGASRWSVARHTSLALLDAYDDCAY